MSFINDNVGGRIPTLGTHPTNASIISPPGTIVVTIPGPSMSDSFSGTYDILSGQTSPNGFWKTEYANGSGAGVQLASGFGNVLWSQPLASTSGTGLEINNNLVLSTSGFTNFDMSVDTRTMSQSRTVFPAKNWERATFVWRYSDSNHYYFYTLKNVGSEFGKRDTTSSGDSPIIINTAGAGGSNQFGSALSGAGISGSFQRIRVISQGKRHQIFVDSSGVTDYTDDGVSGATAAMSAGKVGMFSQDCYGQWKAFQLSGL